ncbi:MAG: branched-chain amino acid ABC transporter permease [bacterium]|nr:branched-chain amino acid ABC transporter permease [bacterium]
MLASLRAGWSRVPPLLKIAIIAGLIIILPPVESFVGELLSEALGVNISLITQVNRALIFVVLALGLNIVVGFAGLLDLGYAAFFAIGAYAFGILTWPGPNIDLGTSFFIAILIAAAVAALFGMIVGAPTLRLRGDYLAIVTLAFGEIIPTLVRNLDEVTIRIGSWTIVEDLNLTNGNQAMNPLGKPDFSFVEQVFRLEQDRLSVGVNPVFWYYVIVVMVIFVLFAARRLENSRVGRAWRAIREDETAAGFMGVNVVNAKLLAFAIGASFSGLAGAVFASMLGLIEPGAFRFQTSIFLLIIVIISGLGSIYGVLIGGLLISLFDGVVIGQILPAAFRANSEIQSSIQSLRWLFFGLGLVAFMLFRPQGLFPLEGRGRKVPPQIAPAPENQPVTEAV